MLTMSDYHIISDFIVKHFNVICAFLMGILFHAWLDIIHQSYLDKKMRERDIKQRTLKEPE